MRSAQSQGAEASCSGRYLTASKAVLAGEPVRHVLWHDPEGSAADSSFMLLKHVDGHDEDDFAPLCFDCGLDLVPDGRALDVARERGEWHACEWEAPAL